MADFEVNRRLKHLIIDVYKTTPFDFSKKYGDNRGVKTSQIMRERNGVSSKMLDAICTAYPEISRTWLLTGEGEPVNQSGGLVQTGDGVNINGVNSGSIVNDHRHYTSDSPDVLRQDIARLETIIAEKEDRIKEKDAQIKEKDAQINKLLDILKSK